MKIVIMAGGKGTRIASINSEVPKPMIEILGKPILEHQVEVLKKQGFNDYIFVIGHLGHVIKDYFGDGSKFGISIEYIVEEEPLGTAGALYFLKDKIEEDFVLLNGDIIFDVDINRFYKYHKDHNGLATILVHPNNHPFDSSLIEVNNDGMVIDWINKEAERVWYHNLVNAGIHILSVKVLDRFIEAKKTDLDRDILKPMIMEKQLFAYSSPEYIKDMGTPKRYDEVISDIKTGKVDNKCLVNKQKAVFLDRDGTINKYVGFLRKLDDFELLDGVSKAIKKINESGYLVIVVTNQPVVARGEVTVDELDVIHKKMETLLGQDGAYIDGLYICPHHPDSGFDGEIKELKIECECRKPKPGMILKAAKDFNIDLSNSYMIGDSENDIKAGMAAGCKTRKVDEDNSLLSIINEIF
ncbi:D-glycero-beta-D-manno-heptose 1,7-bisphosphate 7-phosphatase [Eubacterium sp.]|uniref:D-glycero-beta-D-manno-heptose 1,7-bisphosphate 7-phosphatase n=1 Tax=Eubacterium sp. TaxID=142586 RepID=UPI0025F8CB64|nr:D-glycero-beta-D-manno-heptose 1,7-bisphosphate 7-phosphatase [Eubacterium sp.]MCR5629268.1 D-glycero-beta-D-manno-heptose 1,7-bisphosphate 7-phosphatase [Eubacterium sp.]